jgi:hypothetical protein
MSIEYSVAIPQGAEQRRGDPVSWKGGAWECEGQTYDECAALCKTTMSNVQGQLMWLSTSLGGACAFTGPGIILCYATAVVLIWGMMAAAQHRELECLFKGCNKTFYRVPGSPPG